MSTKDKDQFDFERWLKSASDFSAALKKIGIKNQFKRNSASRTATIAPALKGLPESFVAFLQSGETVSFEYDIPEDSLAAEEISGRIYGGFQIGAAQIKKFQLEAKEWAEDTWVAEFPEDKALWENSLPLISIPNGDFLGVDLRSASGDPQVVYLNHEDTSSILAPSFSSFMQTWEHLFYIGPEIWMLEPFFNSNGHLDSTTPAAKHFHETMLEFLKS